MKNYIKLIILFIILIGVFIIINCIIPYTVEATSSNYRKVQFNGYNDEYNGYEIYYNINNGTGNWCDTIYIPTDIYELSSWFLIIPDGGNPQIYKVSSTTIYIDNETGYSYSDISLSKTKRITSNPFYYEGEGNWSDMGSTSGFYLSGSNNVNGIIYCKGCDIYIVNPDTSEFVYYSFLQDYTSITNPEVQLVQGVGIRLKFYDYYFYEELNEFWDYLRELYEVRVWVFDLNNNENMLLEDVNALDYIKPNIQYISEEDCYYVDFKFSDYFVFMNKSDGDYCINLEIFSKASYTLINTDLFGSCIYSNTIIVGYKYYVESGAGLLYSFSDSDNEGSGGNTSGENDENNEKDEAMNALSNSIDNQTTKIEEQTNAIKEQTEVSKSIWQTIIELPRYYY